MRIETSNANVSKNIKFIIFKKGLKQCAVAKKAGFTATAFCDMLGGRRLIRVCDIPNIARALDVTPNDLFATDNETA